MKRTIVKLVFLLIVSIGFNNISFAQTSAQLIPKKGLFVTTSKLTWITGSEINFLTADRKNHHYYFTWWEQDSIMSERKTSLQIGSENTAVNGSYAVLQEQKEFITIFSCKWNHEDSAAADIVYAKLWFPYLTEAVWRDIQNKTVTDITAFKGDVLQLNTPFGNFAFRSSHPFKIKLAAQLNPGAKDYSHRSQYLLLYEDNISVNRQTGLNRTFLVEEMPPVITSNSNAVIRQVTPERVANAWESSIKQNQLLPQPKFSELTQKQYILPKQKPAVVSAVTKQYRSILQLHWQIGNNYFPNIITVQNNSLADEGYAIEVAADQINLQYKTKQGLQHAVHTLAQLTKNENGQLVIPQGIIKDEPSVAWRGIHMFTGPHSRYLHSNLYNRILLPLKMNKVVLQCEQARWKSRPEIHNSISVPLYDLKDEFRFLRRNYCEPIPLIQSLGHMEWFFKPAQNRFMAVNPQYPYTLNPYLPESQKAVKQLWDETFALLKPTTMHIGFDEIGMIGFNQPKEKEVGYFKTQINFLHSYAQQKNAKLMLWGDMGLAPGEGPDALNGVTKERAAAIRSFIPAGSYVADWHYLNNPNPEVYKSNLEIWKQNNNLPIASPWLWPNNVRGFVHAAIDEKAGVLQTTWADFESSEKNMLLNIEQFGAYILAMDYAWSGRKELPADLPYNPVEEFTQRFYSRTKPISNKNGWRIAENIQLGNSTSSVQNKLPHSVTLKFSTLAANGIKIKASTAIILPEGTPVASIRFLQNGKYVTEMILHYGVEIRGKNDGRCIYAHIPGKDEKTFYDFFYKKMKFNSMLIQNLHPAAGLKVDELILLD